MIGRGIVEDQSRELRPEPTGASDFVRLLDFKAKINALALKIVESNMASQLEERAFALLRGRIPRFYVPSLNERKQVLTWLGMSSKFVRSFDALQLDVEKFEDASGLADFSLIEIKVT